MVSWEKFEGDSKVWDKQVEALGGSIYQCYGWGEVRRVAGWNPLRLLCRFDGGIVSVASILYKRKLGMAICWIPGGPIGAVDQLGKTFRAELRKFLGTPFLYCRLNLLREEESDDHEKLISDGWRRPSAKMSSGLTMVYSLDGSEEERNLRATKNWRRNLRRSERYELQISHWQEPDVEEIACLYREMEDLKEIPMQFSEVEIQSMLDKLGQRIVVFQCRDNTGKLLAIRGAGIISGVGWDLLAAASATARKVYATYGTLWALLNYCIDKGCYQFDLSGVDPEENSGVYNFKKGTGAKLVKCTGEWEWGAVPGIRTIVNYVVKRKL